MEIGSAGIDISLYSDQITIHELINPDEQMRFESYVAPQSRALIGGNVLSGPAQNFLDTIGGDDIASEGDVISEDPTMETEPTTEETATTEDMTEEITEDALEGDSTSIWEWLEDVSVHAQQDFEIILDWAGSAGASINRPGSAAQLEQDLETDLIEEAEGAEEVGPLI